MAAPTPLLFRRCWRELCVAALDAIVPASCAACGAPGAALCATCEGRLEWRGGPHRCRRCGEAVAAEGASCTARHDRITGFAVARSPWRYRGTGGQIVRRFKFDADPAALRLMVRAAVDTLRPWVLGAGRRAVFVSVPMHRSKRRARGHDQAARLAEEVAAALDRQFVPGVLQRTRATLPQGDPRVTDRAANVAGAFRTARPRVVRGRVVVLVDDVTTSGATARACGAVLRAAGAGPLALLTVATG